MIKVQVLLVHGWLDNCNSFIHMGPAVSFIFTLKQFLILLMITMVTSMVLLECKWAEILFYHFDFKTAVMFLVIQTSFLEINLQLATSGFHVVALDLPGASKHIYVDQNMLISLSPTPFGHSHFHPTLAVHAVALELPGGEPE